MDYQVDLNVFRGPLDLLLYLVKRNEVDIFDIPIARIAEQFLQYLDVIQQVAQSAVAQSAVAQPVIDVERAGDFLVMASTLMEIKSRLLLPRAEVEEVEEDPRSELVRQLLEYKRFKDAAALLEQQAEEQALRFPRQPVEEIAPSIDPAQPPGDAARLARLAQPIRRVELWDLVSAFGRLLRETLAVQPKQIVYDDTPIHVYVEQILECLRGRPRMPFADLFDPPWTRGRLVGLFLAILELIKSQQIVVEQPMPFAEIWVELRLTQETGP